MAQILISKLTVEDINSALLRLKRTIDNNEAAFDTKVSNAVSNLNVSNTYQALQKYDDSALKKSINDVSDLIKDLNSSLTKNINQTNTNTESINQLRTILANIDVSYDIETNTLYFTDSTGEEHDYVLKDTTYSFAWDESTRTFTVTDDLTSDSQSFTFSDTKYTLSYSNGVLTFTPSSGTATNIDLKDTFYTESEIRTLVLDLIPNTASASNQLADKNWVNSSIETATATFRGTFTNINDLYAASGDNNDYAFLKTLDPTSGLYTYDRYKWTSNANPHWQYEYTINTSGFTADQLAALNSGITCTLVSKITDVYNCKITLCQNGTCVGSFTLNQNSDSSFNLDGGSISACAKTDNVWRNLLTTDCASTGSIDSTCFSINIKANSCTGLIQSMNTSNWSSAYSSNASCVGCYLLLAQLNGGGFSANHDNTIGGIVYRNAIGADVPYRFVISVRGRCTTVGSTYFRTDKCSSIFYATYQVGTNGSYTLRLYTKVGTNYTRYNTRIDYLTNGDVSTRVSNWSCITFPNTYFASLPSTETQITRGNFYTKCDVGLDNVDNTADANKSVKNADCFNGCTYACACADFRSGLLSDICFDVYCGTTCKCTINNAGSLCLKPNAFNDYAAISTTTYPGACCTGTLVDSDLEPYQTTDCADSKYVFKCILAYPGGGSTCTRYVQIKTLCSRSFYGNTFRIGLYSMDAILNLDSNTSYYGGSCYGDLKFSKCASGCANSDCFWLSYYGYRYPTICSSLPFEVLCTVTTAPSGITFSSFSCYDCLVKYSSVASSADRKLLMAACDGTTNSICPVYFSGCVPLTYNACTGALNIGSGSLNGSLNSYGAVNAGFYCTMCCQASFSFPAQTTTYILLGCIWAAQAQNENQLGFYVCGTNVVNLGVLKILVPNASSFNQNNVELKLANYCNTSYGITGVGFVRSGTAWNCATCIILKVCNPGSTVWSWGVGIHRNQIKNWATCISCLGSTAPTFTGLIDVPTDCRTFYYNNAVACFSNKIQGPAYDANGCAYITSSAVKDSTITLCLNGASKGTFTLNQASNCAIDLGSFICCAQRICRNAVGDNTDRPLALLTANNSTPDACIFVSCSCPLTFNPSTGTLCSTRFFANGYPLKYRQVLNLSSLSTSCFYPITFNANATYEADIEIQSPSVIGACPYNQNYIHFFIRNAGWSDTPHSLYIQTLRRYDGNENVFGCIGYGNSASTLSVIWLRGGLTYYVNANVAMQVNSTNYTHPASGGSCSIYTVGTSLCGGTNIGVNIFASATSFAQYMQGTTFLQAICTNGIRGPACDANGCAYITAASLPSVSDCTITLCLNGTSKGTFTLNQAANCAIDLGCTICRSLEICRNAINDNVDRPLAILGGATSISNASIYVSCGCPLTFNASNGTLINGNTSATNPYLISRGCCIRLNKGDGQSELLFTINNDKTNYCSLGMGIGSGCINRGIYDCKSGTFRWLQYWDASDNEIHNRPTCAPYFRTNCFGYTGFTFVKPDNSGYQVYYLLHDITNWYNGTTNVANRAFIGTITRNREGGYQTSSITSVDVSYAYGRNSAALTCYSNTQHSIYYYNIYTSTALRTVVLKDTTNNKYYSALRLYGSQANFRFNGFIYGSICGTYVCTTNSSGALPSGWELSYAGCLKGGKTVDVYCGTTCKCTLYNGDSLCLGTLAFSSATIPTVYDCTVTLCLNGASKGSFTLNQSSAKTIDFGCVICCADCVKKCLASSVGSYYIPYISSGSETYSPNMYDSNIQYCRVSESVGRLCSSCFEASCSILAKRYQTSSCTLSCSVTSGQTYYLYIGRFLNCPNNQGYSFTVNTSNASCIQDTVCIHLGNGASPSLKIDASNVLGTNGIQCIIFKCYGNECNLIYVAYKPEASQSVCFNFFQNNMSCCFIPAMTLSTSAPSSSNSTIICTKPNGTQAFHYVSGSQLTEGCLSADMVSGNNIKSNNGLILGVTSTCGYISCTCNFTYNRWVRLGCLITCSSDKNVPFTELNLHVKGNCSDDLAAIKISGLTCTPSINIDLAYKYLTSGISCFGFIYNPSTSDPFEVWALLQNNPDAGACVCSAWTLSNGIASERWCGGFTFCTTENAPTFTCKVAVCKVDTGAFSGNAWHWYNGYVSGSVTEADGFSNTKCVRIYAPNGCFCENQSNFAGDVVNLNIPECIGRMCCITTAYMTVNSSLIIPRCHTSANYCIGEMWLTGI